MKQIAIGLLIFGILIACSQKKSLVSNVGKSEIAKNDTVRIANDSLSYEITIIDSGFNSWLATAKPRNYYALSYLENKNQLFVSEWNNRVLNPFRYNPNLYEMHIDYQSNIHYGLEVNYLLYSYFMYFQSRYKQKL